MVFYGSGKKRVKGWKIRVLRRRCSDEKYSSMHENLKVASFFLAVSAVKLAHECPLQEDENFHWSVTLNIFQKVRFSKCYKIQALMNFQYFIIIR